MDYFLRTKKEIISLFLSYKESNLEYLHKGIGGKKPTLHLNVSWKVQSLEERSWTVLISTTPRVLGNCEREHEASQISSFLLQARMNWEQLHPCLPKLNHSNQQTSVWGIIFCFPSHCYFTLKSSDTLNSYSKEYFYFNSKTFLPSPSPGGEILLSASKAGGFPLHAVLPSAGAGRGSCTEQCLRSCHPNTGTHFTALQGVSWELQLQPQPPCSWPRSGPELQALAMLPSGPAGPDSCHCNCSSARHCTGGTAANQS